MPRGRIDQRRYQLKPEDIHAAERKIEEEFQKLPGEKHKAIEGMLSDPLPKDDTVLLPTVDGPPGTGKTYTASLGAGRYFLEEPYENQIILTAVTNYAADRIKEQLDTWFPMKWTVRLGPNPAEHRLEEGRVGCDRWLLNLTKSERRWIQNAPFIVCTPFMLGRVERMIGVSRPVVVVDEFSQVDPPTFFMVLEGLYEASIRSLALFGDPLQLPVVTTQENLTQNIVNYLRDFRSSYSAYPLSLQFRMNEEICDFINCAREELSRMFPIASGHRLIPANEKIRERTLTQLGYHWKPELAGNYQEILDPSSPVLFVDTSELGEEETLPTGSTRNFEEAELACEIARAATRSLLGPKPVIITPYRAQSSLLKQLFPELSENVLTVYKAQGREYPFVIVSFVRNNDRGDIGFLDIPFLPHLQGQGYVALSRAMGKLVVLISRKTFYGHRLFQRLIDEADKKGLVIPWKKQRLQKSLS